jgi:hypothetical protein
MISNVYHVPQLSANLLFVSQIMRTCKNFEFWFDKFVTKDININFVVVAMGTLDPKEKLCKFVVMDIHHNFVVVVVGIVNTILSYTNLGVKFQHKFVDII